MNIPTTEPAQRIAILHHRKLTTPWSDKEVRAYKKLVKAGCFKTFDDLEMIERRYKALWPPDRDKNTLRHGLLAWLNHYACELDRATLWCEQHPIRTERKIIQMPPTPSEPPKLLTAEERTQHEAFMAYYQQHKAMRKQMKGTA